MIWMRWRLRLRRMWACWRSGADDATSRSETMSFEEAMAALEQVVGALEKGDVPLEQSIALYERGAALKAHCARS